MGSGVGHLVLSGPLILAVPVAAAAGAVTFLSPCVLPLVPGYLSYVAGMSGVDTQARPPAAGGEGDRQAVAAGPAETGGADGSGGTAVKVTATAAAARPGRSRTVLGTALFVLGFSATGLTQILGAVTIILGLMFAGVFDRFPIAGRILQPSVRPRAGLAGAPALGVLFGVSWTPCIGPTLTVVLGLAMTSGTAARGALLMFVYGLGLGIPFLIVALLFQRGMTAFGFARRHARLITRAGGALLVAIGVLELTGAWTAVLSWIQTHWVSGYQSPL